ncbi:MAG: biopolymer transporter ExbD [Spirochaetes bacterium]|nr:biopolymer transporter ExbD [Spirochaetota bacterium]
MISLHRKHKKSVELSMTPLIDVIFLLLLFFILTYSFAKPSIPLNLPMASNKEKLQKTDIVVSIDKAGLVYINKKEVPIESLAEVLSERLLVMDKEKRRVIFFGDEEIPYKWFVKVIDIIKNSGIGVVNIAHQEYK